jgi:hypothetical protein
LSKYPSQLSLLRFLFRVIILSDINQIKGDKMDTDCSMHGRKFHTKFCW